MPRKTKTTTPAEPPADWRHNLADFDNDEAAYAEALAAHLEATGAAPGGE